MASIAQMMQAATPDPVADLPRFSDIARPVQGNTTRNPLTAGLSSGVDQLQGAGGAFVAAIGDIVGAKGIKDWGVGVAQRNAAEAAKNGRADLSRPIWEQNFTDLPAWLGYRTAQQVPQMAVQLAGGAVLGRGLARAEKMLPDAVAEIGARTPQALGGGGAGFSGAVTKEALDEGRKYMTDVAGATIAGYPMAVGSMYGEAIERGDPNKGDAITAAIMGPAYAALDAMGPVQLKRLALNGQKGKLASRLLTGVFAGAAAEAPQEAVQTAMEQAFRPDLSPQEKFRNIVDAAVTGAAIGGFLGGGAGIRRTKSPSEVSDDEQKSVVDNALANATAKGPAPTLNLEASPGVTQAGPFGTSAVEPEVVRPHAKEPIERVQSMLADVESRMTAGGGTQQDAINRRQLRDEIAARTAEAQPERPFAQVPDNELAQAAQLIDAPNVTAEQKLAAQQAQAELEARALEGQQLQKAAKIGPSQPEAPGFETMTIPGMESLPIQRSPEGQYAFEAPIRAASDAAQAAKAEVTYETTQAAQQKLASMMGYKSIPKSLQKSDITTEDDGFAYIKERLNKGNASDAVIRAGKEIGLLDDDGNDQTVQTIQQKLASNKAKVTEIAQKAKLTGAAQYTKQLEKLSTENQRLNAQLGYVQRAEAAAQLRERVRNPPTDIKAGPAQMRMPDGQMSSVTVLDTAPTNVQGKLFKQIKNEKGVEAFVPIESLYSSSVPVKEAAAATSPAAQQAEARRPWTAKQKAEAAAAMDRKRPAPVPQDLKSPLWQNTEVGREVTPPPLRGEVGTFTTPQETDAERNARVRARGAYFGGEQDPATIPAAEVDEDTTENIARDFKRYEPLMTEIISDKTLPRELRRAASQARAALREGSNYSDVVERVLADYSSQTGDIQFMQDPQQQTARRSVLTPEQRMAVRTAVANAITADPKEGLRMVRQALSGNLEGLVDSTLQNMSAAKAASDVMGFVENPDGPFAGATRNVVSSATVDPRYADYAFDLMNQIGLGNIRVFVFHPEDIRDNWRQSGLSGPYGTALFAVEQKVAGGVAPFGPDMKDFYMVLDKSMSPERTIEAIAHEVGHIVQLVAVGQAPANVRAALKNAYLKWYEEQKNKSARELVKSLRNRYTAQQTLSSLPENLRAAQLPDAEKYWLSENEWFADQVSRWATTSAKPLSLVDKFFSKVAAMMKMVLKYVTGRGFMPDQTVAQFMDGMAATGAPLPWDGLPGFQKQQNLITNPDNISVRAANDRLKRLTQSSNVILDRIKKMPLAEASDRMNLAHLWTTSINHIVEYFGPLFKPGTLKAYRNVMELQRGLSNRMSHLMAVGYQQWETLAANPKTKAAAEGVQKLMSFTFSDIDPRKKWEDHKHLHGMPNADVLKARVAEANETYRNMQRIVSNGRRASDVYDTLLASNEMDRYSAQTVSLYNLVRGDATVVQSFKDSLVDPVVQFMQDPKVFEDPMAAREYWRAQRDALLGATKKYIEDQLGRLGTLKDRDAEKKRKSTDDLAKFVKMLDAQDAKMQQAPYFHVGRFGDYYASYRVKTDKDGNVPQSTVQQMAKAIEEAGLELSIPVETVVDRMFFRFETQDKANQFEQLMKQFEKKGLITSLPREGQKEGQDPKLGKRGDTPLNREPRWAQTLISQLKANFENALDTTDLTDEEIAQRRAIVNQYESQIHQFFMNMIPDSSLLKVNLQRYGVAGFTPDMMRSYAFRASLGAEALATAYSAPKMTDALKNIRAEVDNAKVLGNVDPKTRYTMQNVLFEIMKREANRAVPKENTFFDQLRALNYNYFLGLSPSFVVTQLTSISSMLWPKLAAKHGFINSAAAIGRVIPTAIKIVRATISHGYEGTLRQAFDASVNSNVLAKAGVKVSDRDFMLRLANAGLFDMGSQSRELGRVIEGNRNSKFDMGMRIAASFGYYSEMFARVTAALAAKELHNEKMGDLDEYARDTVVGSMFEFSNWNTPRAFGKDGILSEATPVAYSFMSYTQQLIETLGREIGKAFFKGAEREARGDKKLEAQLKTEARRFLGAHLVGVGAVAGSLGLPAASAFAVAINAMVDLFGDDDEPFDVKVAYRRWLSNTFGEGVGEVIARGLPRAIGFDISSRVGEADILPFTQFLADRRQFGEAFDSYTGDMMGAPVSMVRNIGEGAAQIINGDIVEGSRVMLPQTLKGLIGAYQMTTKGYTDKKGNALPMDPGAVDIMYQMLGLTPAGKAEYDEQYRAYRATRGEMIRLSSKYRKDLAGAIERNDMAAARELIADVQRFDQNNPEYAVLPSIGQVLASRAKERAKAEEGDVPLGIKPGLADQYSFGNVR